MFEIFKNVIKNIDFDLRDMLDKIDEKYIENRLTKEEKLQLEEMARTNAKAVNSYEDTQKRIDEISEKLDLLEETVNANAKGMSALKDTIEKLGGSITEPTPEPVEEYPEYKQPTGAHDAYKIGDKITFNGEKYECQMDNCVWSPIEYPNAWKKVVE